MRELYFRGKGVFNKDWIYGHSIRNTLGDKKRMLAKQFEIRDDATDNSFWWTAVEQNTVGQWTGLVDNKGNKIFEGDIVKIIPRTQLDRQFLKNKNGLVVWDDESCGFYIKLLSKRAIGMCFPYYKMNANKLEIIGNRYDNKELLERSST